MNIFWLEQMKGGNEKLNIHPGITVTEWNPCQTVHLRSGVFASVFGTESVLQVDQNCHVEASIGKT